MKILLVGDLHTKPDNFDETLRLGQWIVEQYENTGSDAIVFMGDQYHDHGTVKTSVIDFYAKKFFPLFRGIDKAYALVGNHDMEHSGATNIMFVHESQIGVVDQFTLLWDDIVAVPYYRDKNEFIKACHEASRRNKKIVLCHQDFDGAQLENGFYCPGGVRLDLLPPELNFISGHIHRHQVFDRVYYVGAPRQFTRSDIGHEKSISLWDTESGEFTRLLVPDEVCVPFKNVVIDAQSIETFDKKSIDSRTFITITGDTDFIKKALKKVPDGAKVKTVNEDVTKRTVQAKESEGIPTAFNTFASRYLSDKGVDHETQTEVVSLVVDACPFLRG